jgi:hypothetical protein
VCAVGFVCTAGIDQTILYFKAERIDPSIFNVVRLVLFKKAIAQYVFFCGKKHREFVQSVVPGIFTQSENVHTHVYTIKYIHALNPPRQQGDHILP